MKWAKTKSELDQIRKRLMKLGPDSKKLGKNPGKKLLRSLVEDEISQYYMELEDEPSIYSLQKKGFGKWLTVPKSQIPLKYEGARPRYEAFVGGYLYYFEKHASKYRGHDHRVLFFDWGKINKKDGLTIFLSPLHIEKAKNGDPNKSKEPGDKNDEPNNDIDSDGKGNHYDNQNGQDMIKVMRSKLGKKLRKVTIAPSPDGTTDDNSLTQTDPPPPPPPPPPPRE